MIFETHMHIFDNKYDGIRDDIIKESLAVGVTKMIAVGFDYESSLKAIELSEKYPFIYAAIGLHPSEVQKENDTDLKWVYDLSRNKKVIAIGEIGLDYYWDKTYVNLQKEMFIKQIKISQEVNLPIIVHSRDAISDTYEIMKENPTKGVLHCFSSSLEMAREFVKLGYYIGIGGVVTFKNSKEIKRVVSGIDVKYLLTETDSPYLAPVPFRGTINKPSYIPLIIDEISKIKCMNKEIIEDIMYKNACSLFSLKD